MKNHVQQFAILISEPNLDLLLSAVEHYIFCINRGNIRIDNYAELLANLKCLREKCRNSLQRNPSQNTDLPNL